MAKKASNRGGTNLKPFYLLLGVVVLIGAIAIVLGARRGDSAAAVEPVDLGGLDARTLMEKAKGVRVGESSAPVQILVFSDYMCPACAFFNTRNHPLIKEAFLDAGQAQLIYYDFPLGGAHVHSFLAARAARCAEDQGRFWEYHDMLLSRQQDWSYSREAPVAKFAAYAGELNLDGSRFTSCLRSDEHAELVTANYELGSQLGVNATPSVYVNGRRVREANDWNVLRAEIQRELGN